MVTKKAPAKKKMVPRNAPVKKAPAKRKLNPINIDKVVEAIMAKVQIDFNIKLVGPDMHITAVWTPKNGSTKVDFKEQAIKEAANVIAAAAIK